MRRLEIDLGELEIICESAHGEMDHYLDLETIRLKTDLIAASPIELWPQVVVRVPLPEDVERGLIAPLQEEVV